MSGPWLKFYPSDWRADPALRMCSLAARGLWMEMLCLMHEAEPAGSLLVNGRQITAQQLAMLCGVTDVSTLLAELEDAGVFSRDEDGTIFSRRIRRDVEKAASDRENGKRGGNPRLRIGVNPPVNGDENGADKAQKPEARSQNPDTPRSGKNNREGGNPSSPRAKFEFVLGMEITDDCRVVGEAYGLKGEALDVEWRRFVAKKVEKSATTDSLVASFDAWCSDPKYGPALRAAPGGRAASIATIRIDQHSPQGRAWEAYLAGKGRRKPPWTDGRWHFPSEWPPGAGPPAPQQPQSIDPPTAA